MFFEPKHSVPENEFRLHYGKKMHFPLHIHRSFEYYTQIEGGGEVYIGNRTYRLAPGDAVLAFPFEPHAYHCDGRYAICIFSPDLCPDFLKKTEQMLPCDHFFRHTVREGTRTDHRFFEKSFVYEICGSFDLGREYKRNRVTLGDDLLIALLLFAEERFRTECLLRDAARAVGYDYAYVSKFFKRKVGMSFRQYVGLLRVNEAKSLLADTTMRISEIGDACGFSCLRTFDRTFTDVTGFTPLAYREKKEAERHT